MNQTEGARIQQIRGMARRQGFTLRKVRRVDPLALDYGTFELWDGEQKVNEAGKRLDDIMAYLMSAPRAQQAGDVVERVAERVTRHLAEARQKRRRK